LATGLFWKFNYGSDDPAIRLRAHDLTLAMLDRAAWLGTDAILVVPAVVGRWDQPVPEVAYQDALNRTFEALHDLAPEAEQCGVVIAIENVWNRFLLSPVEMVELLDRVNSPWVGAYFDVGNVMAIGYPQDWIATLGRRITRVHLKDYKLEKGTGPMCAEHPPGRPGKSDLSPFCPLCEGDVDWPAVMKALSQAGYDGPLTYEGKGDLADIKARIDRIIALLDS
jgi:L-ribulose-5-phosphate 3-epimerase